MTEKISKPRKLARGGYNRTSNLELYRIIVMLLIVAHHYVVNSGLTDASGVIYSNPMSARSIFLLIFGAWGKTGINCFVLITGYFMCKSQITVKKFFKLLFELEFYNIVIYFIFLLSGYEPFSIKEFVKCILPIYSVSVNFTGCFLLFYLCIPFLNTLIHHLNEKQHIQLILLASFIYIFFGTVPKFSVTMNYVSWFCVLFFIASYIRLYPKKLFENTLFWAMAMLISITLSVVSVVSCAWLGSKIHSNIAFRFVTDSNTFLAVTNGVCSFMFFKNLKIRQSKFINTFAASTFGVLLIHANSDTMRQWIWKDTLNNVGAYGSDLLALHAFGSVIAIFVICTLIDMARIKLIEKPFFKLWDRYFERVSEKYKLLENKICKKLKIS